MPNASPDESASPRVFANWKNASASACEQPGSPERRVRRYADAYERGDHGEGLGADDREHVGESREGAT